MDSQSAPPIEQHTINANKKHDQDNPTPTPSKSKSNDEKLGLEVQQMISKLKKEMYEDGITPVRNDHKKEKPIPDKNFGKNDDVKKPNEESDKGGNNVKRNKQKKKFKKKKKEDSETLGTSPEKAVKKANEVVISNVDTPNEKVVVLNRDSRQSVSAGVSVNDENSIPNERPMITNADHKRDKKNFMSGKNPSNQGEIKSLKY